MVKRERLLSGWVKALLISHSNFLPFKGRAGVGMGYLLPEAYCEGGSAGGKGYAWKWEFSVTVAASLT
jgi:hypothetical protein